MNDSYFLIVNNLAHFVNLWMKCFVDTKPLLNLKSRLRKSVFFIILPIRISLDKTIDSLLFFNCWFWSFSRLSQLRLERMLFFKFFFLLLFPIILFLILYFMPLMTSFLNWSCFINDLCWHKLLWKTCIIEIMSNDFRFELAFFHFINPSFKIDVLSHLSMFLV